ncbi:MAG: hypothetical protein JSV65_04405 [Armatimonadota bacterium]|nr:MAG: hypothetical protein JSV65_04405 [Armatimonadota bacterium]
MGPGDAPIDGSGAAPRRILTARAVLLGLGCVIFLSIATPYTLLVMQGSEIAANHLPAGVMVVFLLLVVVVNRALVRLRERWGLSRGELLLIYVMMLVASAVPARAFLAYVLTVPAGGYYYATPENEWLLLLMPYMKPWLAPHNPETVTHFFEGLPEGRGIPWREWLAPMVAWGLFFILFVGTSMALALVVRKRWVQDERLTYPLAQVPLELVAGEETPHGLTRTLQSRTLWIGFFAALGFHVILGGQQYLPALPTIHITDVPLVRGATRLPMLNLEGTGLHFYPSAVGIGFLLSAEVGLSIWLFWIISKIQLYAIGSYGVEAGSVTQMWSMQLFSRGQQVGAFYLMAFLMLWEVGRRVGPALLHRQTKEDTPQEQREVRWGVYGLAVGLALMWVWCVAAGMKSGYALAAIVLYLTIAFVIARLVAQAGVFFAAWSAEFLPGDMLAYPLGMTALGAPTSFVIYLHQAIFINDRRTITMPFITDALKIAGSERMSILRLCGPIMLGVVAAVVVSYVVGLTIFYRHGAISLWDMSARHIPVWNYDRLKNRWETQRDPNWYFVWWNFVGAAVMLALVQLHRRFLWWRLSPVGYLMGWSPALEQIAASFFIGWAVSSLITRYSTLSVYRRIRPFFIGLVVGEFAGVALWLVVDAMTGLRGHALFPSGGLR